MDDAFPNIAKVSVQRRLAHWSDKEKNELFQTFQFVQEAQLWKICASVSQCNTKRLDHRNFVKDTRVYLRKITGNLV